MKFKSLRSCKVLAIFLLSSNFLSNLDWIFESNTEHISLLLLNPHTFKKSWAGNHQICHITQNIHSFLPCQNIYTAVLMSIFMHLGVFLNLSPLSVFSHCVTVLIRRHFMWTQHFNSARAEIPVVHRTYLQAEDKSHSEADPDEPPLLNTHSFSLLNGAQRSF